MTTSPITKNLLSENLKELLYEKSFNKITILDITNKSGLNRQTFYYHFEDKYELVKWIYNNDLLSIYNEITFANWDKKLLETLKVLKKQHHFYTCIIKSDETYFTSYFINIMNKLFLRGFKKLDIENTLDLDYIKFFCNYFSYGMCGVILDWVKSGMKENEDDIVKKLTSLLNHMKKYFTEGVI